MIFGINLGTLNIGLMKCGESKMAGGGGNKKRFQYCAEPSGQEFFTSELFKVIQDAVPLILHCSTMLIPNNFFEFFCRIECAVNLHSISNSGLIPRGQNLSNRQTVFFTAVNPMNKNQKDRKSLI